MDESGHTIALAQVEIVGDGSAAQAQTRSNGECARLELQPGRYSVTVTAAGYSANSEKIFW
jgi:Carboxypeptidase regulatory-like domain